MHVCLHTQARTLVEVHTQVGPGKESYPCTHTRTHTATQREAGCDSNSRICGEEATLGYRRKTVFLWRWAGSNLLALCPFFSFQWKFLGRVRNWSRLGLPPSSVQSPGPWPRRDPNLSQGKEETGQVGPTLGLAHWTLALLICPPHQRCPPLHSPLLPNTRTSFRRVILTLPTTPPVVSFFLCHRCYSIFQTVHLTFYLASYPVTLPHRTSNYNSNLFSWTWR